MKKAKQTYVTKVHDHQKAKEAAMKAEEEQQTQQSSQTATKLSSSGSTIGSVLYSTGSGKLDKKKKQEEDSNLKVKLCSLSLVVHHTRVITRKRVTSGGAHLRTSAPEQHDSEETSQQWRAVLRHFVRFDRPGNPAPDLPHRYQCA